MKIRCIAMAVSFVVGLSITGALAQQTLMADFNGIGAASTGLDLDNYAVRFDPSSSGDLTKIELYLYRYPDTTSDIQVDLYTVDGDVPGTLISNMGTILAADVTVASAWRQVTNASPPAVTVGTSYFLVLTRIAGSGNYATYVGGHNESDTTPGYAWGHIATKSGTWSATLKSMLALRTYIDGGLDLDYRAGFNWISLSATKWYGPAFTSTNNAVISQVDIQMGNLAAGPGNEDVTVDLYTYDVGTDKPGTLIQTLGVLPAASASSLYILRTVDVTNGPEIAAGTKYFLIYHTGTGYSGNSWSDKYFLQGNSPGYDWGRVAVSSDAGSSWSTDTYMVNFKVYTEPLPLPQGTVIILR